MENRLMVKEREVSDRMIDLSAEHIALAYRVARAKQRLEQAKLRQDEYTIAKAEAFLIKAEELKKELKIDFFKELDKIYKSDF